MRILTYLILSGLCFTLSAQQMGKQTLTQLKESTAGARIIWFLDAIKADEVTKDAIIEQFSSALIDKAGVDGLLATFADINENDGSLVLYSANRVKINEYKLKLKGTKSNEWLEMQFYFDEAEPFQLRGFSIDAVGTGNELLKPMYPTSN